MLAVMQSDLDVQLLLDSKCAYVERLRRAQTETDIGGILVLDQLALARNYVLVNAELLGGSQEKKMPPWTLNENDPSVLPSIALFGGSTPIPDAYTIKVTYGGQTNVKTGPRKTIDLILSK